MDAENMDWCLLADWFALHGLFTLLSYKTQGRLLRDGTIHSEWGPPLLLPGEENTLLVLSSSRCEILCLASASAVTVNGTVVFLGVQRPSWC